MRMTLEQYIRDQLITSYSQLFAEAMKAELGQFLPGTVDEIAANMAADLRTNLPVLAIPGEPERSGDSE